MKKFCILVLGLLFFTSLDVVAVSDKESNEVRVFFNEYSQLEKNWLGGKLVKSNELYGSNQKVIGTLYKIYKDDLQSGYIVYLDDFGVMEASFEELDNSSQIKGDIYYSLPGQFLTESEYHSKETLSVDSKVPLNTRSLYIDGFTVNGNPMFGPNNVTPIWYDYYIDSTHISDLTINNDGYTTSYSSQSYVENVPDYHNYDYGPTNLGCFPTSAAMLIAYYDNEYIDTFQDLDGSNGDFPLNHSSDKNLVDSLIIEMSGYTGNLADYFTGQIYFFPSNAHAVTGNQGIAGVNNYLEDINHDEFIIVADSFDSRPNVYRQLIDLGNPSMVIIDNHSTYNASGLDHCVLGIGYYTAYQSDPGIMVHDNWQNTGRVIWLNYTAVSHFMFLYKE